MYTAPLARRRLATAANGKLHHHLSVCLLKAHQSLFAGSCPSHYSSFAGGPSEIFYFAGRMKDIQFPPGIKENEAKYLVSSERDFLDSVCPLCRRRETVALHVGGVTSLSLSLEGVITFYLEPPPLLSLPPSPTPPPRCLSNLRMLFVRE